MQREKLREVSQFRSRQESCLYLDRGEYGPSLILALRISEALNKEASELFSLSEPTKGKK
jgi:DNA-binding XRE family transcriptional regulator